MYFSAYEFEPKVIFCPACQLPDKLESSKSLSLKWELALKLTNLFISLPICCKISGRIFSWFSPFYHVLVIYQVALLRSVRMTQRIAKNWDKMDVKAWPASSLFQSLPPSHPDIQKITKTRCIVREEENFLCPSILFLLIWELTSERLAGENQTQFNNMYTWERPRKNWVTCQNGWNPHLIYHIQPKT